MINRIVKIGILAVLIFGSNTFAKESTAEEIQSWIVIQSSEHVSHPYLEKDSEYGSFFKISRGSEPCSINIKMLMYKRDDIAGSIFFSGGDGPKIRIEGTVNFKKDVSRIEVNSNPKKKYYEMTIYGNLQVRDKDGTISDEKYRWILFKNEKNMARHLKAYKKLLEVCRDVKEDLF